MQGAEVMFEVGLFSNGVEIISVTGYTRQQKATHILHGRFIIFSKLGTVGHTHNIDEVVLYYPAPNGSLYKRIKISVHGNSTVFHHTGGKNLIIKFTVSSKSVPESSWMDEEIIATATESSQEDVDDIRAMLDAIDAVEAESIDNSNDNPR
jgi:hypothetical protein